MTDLYLQSDGRDMTVWHDDGDKVGRLLTEHQAGPVLWAHLVATLPTRDEPQPEPLDPGVRVRDSEGEVWARIDGDWVTQDSLPQSWPDLREGLGPLTIITPAPEPTPDERPFQVGDRVRVADDAMSVNFPDIPSEHRGKVGSISSWARESQLVAWIDGKYLAATKHLQHADAPC